ncbi:MAG: 4-phosphoerythronate dehydrogenase [Paludibacteraceae bacterium]|nr:4-phosphoerythronate dehydrogenase [Paludibacteraceae bacterium]
MFNISIVSDKHIPFLVEAVQTYWPNVRIIPMKSDEIDTEAVRQADVLVVRTRTRINESLLAGSRVRLVCTATIGFDHIDTVYCEQNGIQWISCPGCNAQAVCDYIQEALEEYQLSNVQCPMSQMPTIGVVGVGHVGSLVAKMAEQKGYQVLLNDPPKKIGVSLDFIAKKCDIITFHVPLDETTYHLCNAAFLSKCKPNALIINAARGGVVDEQALLQSGHPFILDTWENEPSINPLVLQKAFRASMHIAGYSLEGKRNATQTCLQAIAQTFQLPSIPTISIPPSHGDTAPGWLERITEKLKKGDFEQLRKSYPLR